MPKTCSQCQSEAADAATFCPNCGATLAPAAAAGSAPSAPPPPTSAASGTGAPATAAPSGSGLPAFKFEAARWSNADRIAGIATVLLFISLFLPWFTVSIGLGGVSLSGSVNGLWHWWMYFTLILCIVTVAYLVLRAGWDQLPISQEVPHLTVMMTVTIINAVLVLIAFIDKPGGGATGWGAGAVIGLIAALVAAAPYAIAPLRERTM